MVFMNMKHYQVRTFFSEFSKRFGGRNGFAYLNTKCFHWIIFKQWSQEFSQKKKKKKNADFKKPLEIVPKLKRAQSHHFGVFGTKEELYIITRNLCKNGELFLWHNCTSSSTAFSLLWGLRCRVASHLKLLKWQSKRQYTVYLTEI